MDGQSPLLASRVDGLGGETEDADGTFENVWMSVDRRAVWSIQKRKLMTVIKQKKEETTLVKVEMPSIVFVLVSDAAFAVLTIFHLRCTRILYISNIASTYCDRGKNFQLQVQQSSGSVSEITDGILTVIYGSI